MSRRITIGRHFVVCAVLAVASLLCVRVDSSVAAPSISSVSGTVANGQVITVSGSSFGSGPNVLLFNDFEGGANGSTIATGSGSAKVGQWASSQLAPTYSNSQKVSGNLAGHFNNHFGSAPYYNNLTALIPAQNKVFLSYWQLIDAWPTNTTQTDMNWKAVWLMNTGTTDYDMMIPQYLGTLPGASTGFYDSNFLDSQCRGQTHVWGPDTALSTWRRIWIFVDATTDGNYIQSWEMTRGGGIVQVATSANSASSCWFGNYSGSFAKVVLNGYMPNANTTQSNAYWDDVYIAYGDNAMARVEIGNAPTYNACTNLTLATPTSWTASSISATVWQGSFTAGSSAYLYVVDSTGTPNANGYPVTLGSGGGGGTYYTATPSITSGESGYGSISPSTPQSVLSGTPAVFTVTANSGYSASVAGSCGGSLVGTTYTTNPVAGACTVIVTYTPSPGGSDLAWNALSWAQQNNNNITPTWTNSVVTYCARILVQGNSVTQSGGSVKVGFQGRADGSSYSVSGVSVAQRDTTAPVGNVVASTWTPVTFGGAGTATIPPGVETLSDPIPFNLAAGQDYYVTFMINTPSVYLSPLPTNFTELYFSGVDHTGDVQWSGIGYSTTNDYHALSTIHALPAPPSGLRLGP